MPLDSQYGDLQKIRDKLGKSELSDPKKAAAIKKLDANLKELKQFADQQKKLQKDVADANKLQDSIDKFKKSFGDYIKESSQLATEINKLPDTPQHSYSQIASRLAVVGSADLGLDIGDK